MIVAFTGKKGHGKDTAAGALEKAPSLHVNFANPVKRTCRDVFGLTVEEMSNPVLKETKLDRWPFQSPRTIMQLVGTEAFRAIWPDVWINHWERTVKEYYAEPRNKGGMVVTTDLRFINEYNIIKKHWGIVIRIVNPRIELTDTHQSETEMDKITSDFIIINDGSIEDLHKKVRELDL